MCLFCLRHTATSVLENVSETTANAVIINIIMLAPILQLPTELLQQVAQYGVDVTALRLVCKSFDRALFDTFAEEYLTELQCFLLDKKRLERLITILSRPYMARKVKKVLLSLDPLEGKQSRDIPVALLPHFEDQFEIGQILSRMSILESNFEPYLLGDPPAEYIALGLQSLRLADCPFIVLDCRLQTMGLSMDLRHSIEANANQIILDILRIIFLSKTILSEIRLSETFFLDQFSAGHGHCDWLSTLQAFTYEADLEDLKRVFGNAALNQPPQLHNEWSVVMVLRAAQRLQELRLNGPFDPRRVRSKTCMDFSRVALQSSHFRDLRKVELSCVQCAADPFWGALRAWKGTLEDLKLDTFSLEIEPLTARGQGWTGTFGILLACPQLTKLCLNVLYERTVPGDASPSLDLRSPDDDSITDHCYLESASQIRKTLHLHMDSGSTFSYKIKSSLIRDRVRDEYAA